MNLQGQSSVVYKTRDTAYNVLVVHFFRIFVKFFCFVVAVFDQVHDVEAIHGLLT